MPVFACFLSQKSSGQTPQHFFALEIGFDWVRFGFVLAFYWLLLALIGFVLGSFSPSVQLDLFS